MTRKSKIDPKPLPTLHQIFDKIDPKPLPTLSQNFDKIDPKPLPTLPQIFDKIDPKPLPTLPQIFEKSTQNHYQLCLKFSNLPRREPSPVDVRLVAIVREFFIVTVVQFSS